MNRQMRFGKRIPLPSTAQIKHELRLLIAADAVIAACGTPPLTMQEVAAVAGKRVPPL